MDLTYRSEYLLGVIEKYCTYDDTILEIGCGDNRNVKYLRARGYDVKGIDKIYGSDVKTVKQEMYDVIFTMATLFLIQDPPWKKIGHMARKYIITIEGETTKGNGVRFHDYKKEFEAVGFKQIEHQIDVFNMYGVLRIFKKI